DIRSGRDHREDEELPDDEGDRGAGDRRRDGGACWRWLSARDAGDRCAVRTVGGCPGRKPLRMRIRVRPCATTGPGSPSTVTRRTSPPSSPADSDSWTGRYRAPI